MVFLDIYRDCLLIVRNSTYVYCISTAKYAGFVFFFFLLIQYNYSHGKFIYHLCISDIERDVKNACLIYGTIEKLIIPKGGAGRCKVETNSGEYLQGQMYL